MSDLHQSKENPIARWAGFFVRILIATSILAYLARKVPSDDWSRLGGLLGDNWKWMLLGVGFTFAGLVAGSVRWGYLLTKQSVRVPDIEVFRVFFIGQFFNSFMLGACGGDVARAYYIIHHSPDARTSAASTVLADRLIGLFVTVVFSVLITVCRVPVFLALENTRQVGLVMIAFLVCFMLGSFLVFRRHLFEQWAPLRKLQERTIAGRLLRKGYDALYLYRSQPKTLAYATLLSLLNLIFLTLAAYAFGRSIGIRTPVLDYFTLFPLIIVVTAVPITPGALGIREYCFAMLFGAVGVSSMQAITLSLLIYAGGIFWSLFGGILFVTYGNRGPSIRQQLKELREQATEDA